MSNEYEGHWLSTSRVSHFHFLDPPPDEIIIEDIAHALALTCRFGGHCSRFYSVAEHCVRASKLVGKRSRLAALLHDAEEAYVPDVPRPIKAMLPQVRDLYWPINEAILFKFNAMESDWEEIKKVDDKLCVTEAKALGVWNEDWADLGDPFDIDCGQFGWTWEESEERYLKRFYEIYKRGK